jgi:hypothetical protein
VRPHSEYVNNVKIFFNGIDNAMLNIDAVGIEAFEVSDELFKRWE